MTVEQLIAELRSLPSSAIVLIEAYEPEQGYNHFRLSSQTVRPGKPEGYWDGEFRLDPDGIPAVLLDRHHEQLP